MKKISIISILMLAILLVWSCKKDDTPPQSKLEQRQFTSAALMGNPAGSSAVRDMTVYTPEGYEPKGDKEYPVVYLLHGLPFGDSAYISKEKWDAWVKPDGVFKTYPDLPQEGFKAWIDNLILAEKIDPMIIVMADGESKPYSFSMYTNSVLNGNFEDYIANDLVSFIDANYKTIASKDGRALIGHSQGGYGAFKLGMKHADKFSVVAAHGAPLVLAAMQGAASGIIAENPDGMNGPHPDKFLTSSVYAFSAAWSPNLDNPPWYVDLTFEWPSGAPVESVIARWMEHDPLTMLNTYGEDFKTLKGIYFDIGDKDQFKFGLAYPYFTQALDALGIAYTSEVFDGDHFDKMYERLEISLAFCSQKMHQQ